jgi:four helix bundle protein
MTSYKELTVWQQSYKFGLEVYSVTKNFPADEKYGLVSQLRRASLSIPSNIAEGSKRGTRKDYRSFIIMAYGSSAEIETQLLFSKDLGIPGER